MKTIVLTAALLLTVGAVYAAEPLAKPEGKPEPKLDAETKAKLKELEAQLNDLFGQTEPVKCYRMLSLVDSGMIVGLAVQLCGGSVDGAKTVQCYGEASKSSDDGGLGLNRGLAVDLCKATSRQ